MGYSALDPAFRLAQTGVDLVTENTRKMFSDIFRLPVTVPTALANHITARWNAWYPNGDAAARAMRLVDGFTHQLLQQDPSLREHPKRLYELRSHMVLEHLMSRLRQEGTDFTDFAAGAPMGIDPRDRARRDAALRAQQAASMANTSTFNN